MRVAVTGNIGSGKTTFASMLAALGAVRVDADVLARMVVDESPVLRQRLAEAFGADLLDGDGRLDRRALGRRALADSVSRQRLEELVRPHLEPRIWQALAAAEAEARVVVFDAPLLFEWGLEDRFDVVVLVTAAAETADARVVAGRGVSTEEVAERRAALRRTTQRQGVDFVVDNDGSLDDLRRAAAQIAAAVQQRRPGPGGRR